MLLVFTFTHYPHLKGIIFDDDSNIKSLLHPHINVALKYIYVAIYGTTWYGYHFSAKPADLINVYDMLGKT
jgi:hypothetical protein